MLPPCREHTPRGAATAGRVGGGRATIAGRGGAEATSGQRVGAIDISIGRGFVVETLIAAAILVAGVFLAGVASRLMHRIVGLATSATETDLDDALARQARLPARAAIVVQAAYAAALTLSWLDPYSATLRQAWAAATLFVAIWLLWRLAGATFDWYASRPDEAQSLFGQKTLPLLRRIANVAIGLGGATIVLEQLGVAISPLLAGLGIGGLAVALAAQPILANIFSGSYVLSDRSIGVGDFLEIDGGPTGWVEDIGLRATRIRTFDNNLVLVPNATLAQATVTNCDADGHPTGASVTCGVAYEENLETVEATVREVLAGIVEDLPSADPEYEPLVMFLEFGESNVDFLMKLRATDRRSVGGLRHEMIKRVHTRLTAEGIVVNYPARRLLLDEDDAGGLERLAAAPARNGGP